MKKLEKMFFLLAFLLILTPIRIEAKTIREFEQEVAKFTKDLEEKQNKIAKNEAEVKQIKENIAKKEAQIADLESQTKAIQKEIDESNLKIEEKSQQSKELFQYLQVSEGNNAYMEYIFGARNVTDMIYRISIVEQLTDYNKKVMEELKELIEKNKAKKEDLSNKKEELKKLAQELESEKERINEDTKSIREAMPGVQEQLKSAKENLAYYKKLGCGATEDIYACQFRIEQAKASSSSGGSSGGGAAPLVPSADGFHRPMTSGYVTQNWGGYGGHLGMDLSNTNKTIDIYPIADGVVFKKYYDSYGALVLKIRHNVGGRYLYSTYAHLSNWYVNEGQVVSYNTRIGSMGNTGYSFGAHLHLEITTCDWNRGGGCTWGEYQRSTINPRQYISLPNTLRAWWYDR